MRESTCRLFCAAIAALLVPTSVGAAEFAAQAHGRYTVLAQNTPGSTGGTIGKQNKSISGGSSEPESRPPAQEPRARPSSDRARGATAIVVTSATYGGNCGAAAGNATQHLRQACNGKSRCDYVIDYQVIGDPKVFCGKDYVAQWRCGQGSTHSATVAPEAGYRKTINLTCEGRSDP